MSTAKSITVIGGADGPTAIFIAGNPFSLVAIVLGVMVLIAVLCFMFIKNKKK